MIQLRFDGRDFLTRFEGKKILFVGDSLSLNQWQSLTCMLYSAVPSANYTLARTGAISTFTFKVMCFVAGETDRPTFCSKQTTSYSLQQHIIAGLQSDIEVRSECFCRRYCENGCRAGADTRLGQWE